MKVVACIEKVESSPEKNISPKNHGWSTVIGGPVGRSEVADKQSTGFEVELGMGYDNQRSAEEKNESDRGFV